MSMQVPPHFNQHDSRSTPAPLLQVGVLVLLALAAMSAYLTRHCIAVANTKIQSELEIDDEQMGWVLGAFAAGYFWFQIPGGWLGNKIGTRAALPLIHTLWSLCTFWSSLATSWLILAASRVAYGCAQAGMVPLTAKVINDWFHVNHRGICSATFAASMSVGGVISMGLTGNAHRAVRLARHLPRILVGRHRVGGRVLCAISYEAGTTPVGATQIGRRINVRPTRARSR